MAAQRIYSITEIETGEVFALVSATTKAQALAHYARRTLGCAVAIPEQLIAATKDGIEVETAGAEAGE
jgi:hypothetical protein